MNRNFITLLILTFPLLIRLLNYNLGRFHGDDLMGAYFSNHLNFNTLNPFAGIPIPATDWEAQFAPPFFILQKIFFMVFGANLLTVKLSILPYVFIISLLIYSLTKLITDKKTALIAVFLYSFLAFNIYMETVGLWVVSGSAVFLIFFYLLINYLKIKSSSAAFIMGISCAISYLFYFTGYAAFPVMAVVLFGQLLMIRNIKIFKNCLLALTGFALILSPYLIYTFHNNNYFIERAQQMSFLTPNVNHLKLMIRSLYENGLGGHGGVNFGHFALFDRFSLSLLLLGLLTSIFLTVKKPLIFSLIYFVIILSFIPFIFSLPPPAYHRLDLIFPFVSIISALPFYLLLSTNKLNNFIKYLTVFIFLIIYAFVNETYFLAATYNENYNSTLKVAGYINNRFPNRMVYSASYPGFIFDKIYYFSEGKNAKKIDVGYHLTYLKDFKYNEKYVYVITFPEEFDDDFISIDPNGKLIKFNNEYSLFVN